MKNKIILSAFLLSLLIVICSFNFFDNENLKKKPKYIFLFIGDGMGINQAFITNKYLETQGEEGLSFIKFPNFALTTTYCLDSAKITDSAASGTALATGQKTQYGVIGMNKETGEKYTSIAEIAKLNMWKVGILSSVGLNHATPAAFYGNQVSRGMYIEIADQMKETNFDLFAGGGIMTNEDTTEFNRILIDLKNSGYQIITEKEKFSNDKKYSDKIFYSVFDMLGREEEFAYAIDYEKNEPTLADFTDFAISYLDNDEGFFIMVEGGKIDWACHNNDGAAAVNEVIAFDEAVKKALDFYNEHPEETLIIITADHETGGMSFGSDIMDYDINYSILAKQKVSVDKLISMLSENKIENYSVLISENIGFKLETDYFKNKTTEVIAYSLIDSLNQTAGIGWTTGDHTGIPIGTYAIGVGAELFNGIIDNTEIVKNILKITELKTLN